MKFRRISHVRRGFIKFSTTIYDGPTFEPAQTTNDTHLITGYGPQRVVTLEQKRVRPEIR